MKKERWGMKGRNVCGFADGLDASAASLSERQARHTGFMLLVHKFPVNGACMSWRPPRSVGPRYPCSIVTLPRDFPRSALRFYRLPFFLLFVSPFPLFLRLRFSAVAVARFSSCRNRPSVYENMTGSRQ